MTSYVKLGGHSISELINQDQADASGYPIQGSTTFMLSAYDPSATMGSINGQTISPTSYIKGNVFLAQNYRYAYMNNSQTGGVQNDSYIAIPETLEPNFFFELRCKYDNRAIAGLTAVNTVNFFVNTASSANDNKISVDYIVDYVSPHNFDVHAVVRKYSNGSVSTFSHTPDNRSLGLGLVTLDFKTEIIGNIITIWYAIVDFYDVRGSWIYLNSIDFSGTPIDKTYRSVLLNNKYPLYTGRISGDGGVSSYGYISLSSGASYTPGSVGFGGFVSYYIGQSITYAAGTQLMPRVFWKDFDKSSEVSV